MPTSIIIVLVLTLIIHLVSTLAYAVRIVGIRTRKIAISFALFNIMVLISRTSNSFQAPLLAKWIEDNIHFQTEPDIMVFRLIILTTTVASAAGSFLIPSFQRILSRAVNNFSVYKSVPRLILHGFTKSGIRQFRDEIKLPDKNNFRVNTGIPDKFPVKIFVFNIIAVAILTVGVLSSLYAGYLVPELRTTSSTLSSVVNGFATILLFIFIDPYLSGLTDDVIEGKYMESDFRLIVRIMLIGRILGTILSQFLFVPFSKFIAFVAIQL